jgi:hypothetical protein
MDQHTILSDESELQLDISTKGPIILIFSTADEGIVPLLTKDYPPSVVELTVNILDFICIVRVRML